MMSIDRPARPPSRPAAGGIGGGRPRARVLVASAALHGLLLVGMMLIPKADYGGDRAEATRVTFYAPALPETAPPPPPPLPAIPEPAPRPAAEPPPPVPEPPPPKVEPPRPRPTPRVVRDRPAPPPPAPVEPRPEPPRPEPRPAGFAAPVETATPAPRRAARTGSFGAAVAAETVRTDAPRVVARGSFGTENGTVASVAPTARPAGTVVATTGFDSTAAPAGAGPSRPTATVTRGGFGDADGPAPAARPAARRERPAAALDTPVEIVAKPKPVYTDDARARRIEGEVVLQVTFDAAGTVHVHGVVQGLGFGLDEAAVDAAEEIEFKPARRDGRPVDHTATLRVVFRLA